MQKSPIHTCLLLFVLLLAISYGYAQTSPEETAKHWQKTLELNQLAERFKAETGFRGKMNYNFERMKLGSFEGNFTDIPFSTDADTTSFRQACNRIIDKILPYSYAKRSQLSMSRITKSGRGYTTDYIQSANGYRVEGSGFIMITYEDGRKHFSIGDNTVELPESVQINITREDAINRALEYHKNKVNPPEHKLVPYVIEDLRFCNPDEAGYALKYIIYLGDLVYYVDSSTGRIDWGNTISDE